MGHRFCRWPIVRTIELANFSFAPSKETRRKEMIQSKDNAIWRKKGEQKETKDDGLQVSIE